MKTNYKIFILFFYLISLNQYLFTQIPQEVKLEILSKVNDTSLKGIIKQLVTISQTSREYKAFAEDKYVIKQIINNYVKNKNSLNELIEDLKSFLLPNQLSFDKRQLYSRYGNYLVQNNFYSFLIELMQRLNELSKKQGLGGTIIKALLENSEFIKQIGTGIISSIITPKQRDYTGQNFDDEMLVLLNDISDTLLDFFNEAILIPNNLFLFNAIKSGLNNTNIPDEDITPLIKAIQSGTLEQVRPFLQAKSDNLF